MDIKPRKTYSIEILRNILKLLEEEKETDEKLSELAAQINTTANEHVEEEAVREQGKKSKRVA